MPIWQLKFSRNFEYLAKSDIFSIRPCKKLTYWFPKAMICIWILNQRSVSNTLLYTKMISEEIIPKFVILKSHFYQIITFLRCLTKNIVYLLNLTRRMSKELQVAFMLNLVFYISVIEICHFYLMTSGPTAKSIYRYGLIF